jgi:uncharacterized alkaline shock family protein YloU
MIIKVDDAIPGGIYLDKETNTYVESDGIINIAVLDEYSPRREVVAEIIARLAKLNDSEIAIYKTLLNEISITKHNQVLVSYAVDKATSKYGKTIRAYYKAIKTLIEKRIITYCGVDYIKVNINYNFISDDKNNPEFVVIRLTNGL